MRHFKCIFNLMFISSPMVCDHYSHFTAEETEHREAKYFAQDYTARKWPSQDSRMSPDVEIPL